MDRYIAPVGGSSFDCAKGPRKHLPGHQRNEVCKRVPVGVNSPRGCKSREEELCNSQQAFTHSANLPPLPPPSLHPCQEKNFTTRAPNDDRSKVHTHPPQSVANQTTHPPYEILIYTPYPKDSKRQKGKKFICKMGFRRDSNAGPLAN